MPLRLGTLLLSLVCLAQTALASHPSVFLRRRLARNVSAVNETLAKSFEHGRDQANRVAICLTGQLRSTNITWTSPHLLQNQHRKMFGDQDPPTTAGTIVEWLFRTLATRHGVDVFMFLTAHPETNNSDWDGSPHTYEPMVGDTRGCEIFSNNDIFNGTGNRFFCLVEPELQLMNPFVEKLPQWKNYGKPLYFNEQALAQLYSIYRANLAAKQYALSANVSYAYKIRLRPDTAFVKPFPPLDSIDFGPLRGRNCKSTIFFANKIIYRNGNEDWFNVGRTEDMDILLDRYLEFISTPFVHNSVKAWWDLEDHLVGLLDRRHNICMAWYHDIWMVVIRKANHRYNGWVPPPEKNQWKEMST